MGEHRFSRVSMNAPADREYTQSHEWVRVDGESAVVGITACDPAIAGECLAVRLPEIRSAVKTGDVIATILFADRNRDIRAPLSGSVVEINRVLESNPQLVRTDPYGAGWLFRLNIEAGEEIEHLLGSTAYSEQVREAETMDIESP
jgi:glycine cleavage system H protein